MKKIISLTTAFAIISSMATYADLNTNKQHIYDTDTLSRGHPSQTLEKFSDNNKENLSMQPLPQESTREKLIEEGEALQDPFFTKSLVIVEKQNEEHPEIKRSSSISNPSLAGFTIDDTIEYGKLAQLAYIDTGNPAGDKFETIEKLQAEGNRVQFFGTEAENSGLIITHKDGRISVVYKGTNSLRNVATDTWFNFAIDDQTGLRCHNGIMKGFYRTKDQVFAILEQIAKARAKTVVELLNDDVTVTGHSLGGGLSQMFMGYAFKIYGAIPKSVTYATPRVFDISTAEELEAKFHDRYLNVMQVTDPVPGIALGAVGYKHFGTKLHIPYAKSDLQHKMSGYLLALEGMSGGVKIKVGNTIFAYEESKRTGIGKAKWVGNTYIPNPIYPIHILRESMARHVDPIVHKAVKAVKDTAINMISDVGNAARKVWDFLWD